MTVCTIFILSDQADLLCMTARDIFILADEAY